MRILNWKRIHLGIYWNNADITCRGRRVGIEMPNNGNFGLLDLWYFSITFGLWSKEHARMFR